MEFTNVLAHPLFLPRSENWKVCVHSFICSNNFVRNKKVNFIKIYSPETQARFGGVNYLSIHRRKKFDPIRERVHHFTPTNKEFFELNSEYLEKLSITLFDNFEQKTRLAFGQPTYVLLEFRQFNAMEDITTIRVSNRQEKNWQNAKNFNVSFPPSLSMSIDNPSHYEIALSSITFEPVFSHLLQPEGIIQCAVRVGQNIGTPHEIPYNLSDQFSSPDQFVDALQKAISTYEEKYAKENNVVGWSLFQFKKVSPKSRRYYIATETSMKLRIAPDLAIVLGFDRDPDRDGKVSLTSSDRMLNILAFKPINLYFHYPTFLLLYTNFVKATPFGDAMVQVLKSIPINIKDNSGYETFESKSLEYHQLSFKDLDNLNFNFRTVTGEEARFSRQRHQVMLSLFIRRKK